MTKFMHHKTNRISCIFYPAYAFSKGMDKLVTMESKPKGYSVNKEESPHVSRYGKIKLNKHYKCNENLQINECKDAIITKCGASEVVWVRKQRTG